VHIHIRVLGRIWAFARSWLVFCRDHSPKKITAFTAHISIAYDSPGFSSFGHDPCPRIMMVFAFFCPFLQSAQEDSIAIHQ